ncbi:MAG: class I SAM-dependent methyltransferase [Rhodothermaceae bacterium]|nr:class I SAM-dependent methyltransferase [Rhodothermaceae bacterium]
MSYYEDEQNARAYIAMAEGYDGRAIIERLKAYLPLQSSVLELGMGPGVDLDLLKEAFVATGSDKAQPFLDRYRQAHPDADLLVLDAATLDTDRTFDCIYSNKVLHHLTSTARAQSLAQQHGRLNEGGLICHTFWHGDRVEEHHGLQFHYLTEAQLAEALAPHFEMLVLERYTEMETDDSVLVIARKL